MILSKYLSLLSVFALTILTINSYAAGLGQDGKAGEVGKSGSDGNNGNVGINWVPRDPNPEYFFYFPIKNGDLREFKKVLAGGAKVNWPMTNIIGRPSAFEVAIEVHWLEGIQVMFENSDPKNQPDTTIRVKARNGSSVNIYEFLTIGDYLDENGKLTNPRFLVSPTKLEILKLILKHENDLDFLEQSTGANLPLSVVLPALKDSTNPFFNHPNNVEALNLIQGRIAELRSKK